MRNEILATVLVVIVAGSLSAGYLVGSVGQKTTTTVSTITTTSVSTVTRTTTFLAGSQAVYVSSPDGIRLGVSANASEITVGQYLNISLSIVNTLPRINSVEPAEDWLFQGVPVALWPPCYFGLPAEAAVLQGNYSIESIGKAANTTFSYICMESVSVDHVIFQPNSDQVSLTGPYSVTGENHSLGPFHMSLSFTTGGYWDLKNLSSELNIPILGEQYHASPPAYVPFLPGAYTIAVADEWGQVAILHIRVIPG